MSSSGVGFLVWPPRILVLGFLCFVFNVDISFWDFSGDSCVFSIFLLSWETSICGLSSEVSLRCFSTEVTKIILESIEF